MAPPARAPATEIGPVTAHLSVSATAYLSGVKSSGDENEFPKPSTHSTSNRLAGLHRPERRVVGAVRVLCVLGAEPLHRWDPVTVHRYLAGIGMRTRRNTWSR